MVKKCVSRHPPHTHTAAHPQTSHTLSTASTSGTSHQYSQLADISHQYSQCSGGAGRQLSGRQESSFHPCHWKPSSSCPTPAELPIPSHFCVSIHSCSPGEAWEASSPTAGSPGSSPRIKFLSEGIEAGLSP